MIPCSEIHTKHTDTLCENNVYFYVLNLIVHVIKSRIEMTHEKLDPQIPYRFTLDWDTVARQF